MPCTTCDTQGNRIRILSIRSRSAFLYILSPLCFLCIFCLCVCVCVWVFRALPGLAACSSEAHTRSHWLRRHLQHWQTGERREEGHSQERLIYSLSSSLYCFSSLLLLPLSPLSSFTLPSYSYVTGGPGSPYNTAPICVSNSIPLSH